MKTVRSGKPDPLGATWDGDGVNFALFSAHAEAVELCLFDPAGRRELERVPLPEYSDQVWHGYLPGLAPGQLYGYRVHGPYDPAGGHRFNPNKLLVDPYAKELHGTARSHAANLGYQAGNADADLSFDRRNNARYVPKCRVTTPPREGEDHQRPRVPWTDTVIYELHVRGFTKRHPDVPAALRGTFAGLGTAPVVEHIAKLGVTTVELMPVHPAMDEWRLARQGLRNYWGYNPYNYFAPAPRYMSRGDRDQFAAMVRRFHEAGIEVILDVVYNHSGEGDQFGPTLSFRGIDNASYYRLAEQRNRYVDDTGCGNTLNLGHPRVLRMVVDSLRYWADEMGVDGFRFDLATTLAREAHGFDREAGFLEAVGRDPVLSRLKLIAEPWDLGPGAYQLGNFPSDWGEWNDRYRDSTRRYWKGDAGMIGEFAQRLAGSQDYFGRAGRRPWSSINFVTAHDGFTLHDLVSYDAKHNEANLENNADGSNQNHSWNCGAEGATEDRAILALRARQKRNMMATLLLSLGTPMLLAGDEFGRSQLGNSNAYCQDNEIGWTDWENWSPDDKAFLEFVRTLLRIRREHPVFRRRGFFSGREIGGTPVKDIAWLAPEGQEMTVEAWEQPTARCLGALLLDHGEGDEEAAVAAGREARLIALFNAAAEPRPFVLPPPGERWEVMFDTARPAGGETDSAFGGGESYPLAGRAVVLLRSPPASP